MGDPRICEDLSPSLIAEAAAWRGHEFSLVD